MIHQHTDRQGDTALCNCKVTEISVPVEMVESILDALTATDHKELRDKLWDLLIDAQGRTSSS